MDGTMAVVAKGEGKARVQEADRKAKTLSALLGG
jgi:hypothetical protein